MAAWYAIVSGGKGRLGLDRIGDVDQLAALGAWRANQGVYRFDQDLYEAVQGTPIEGDLPTEILYCPSVQSAARGERVCKTGIARISRGGKGTPLCGCVSARKGRGKMV